MRTLVLTVLLAGAAIGCSARNAGPVVRPEPATIEVENRRFADMVIYALDGTRRIRIGTATGNLTTRIRIPAHIVATGREVRFVADPIGSDRTGVSEQIFVQPGQTVKLTILP
jgi:multidrug efflux pump subunit AcrA (membrane-fusion protein)